MEARRAVTARKGKQEQREGRRDAGNEGGTANNLHGYKAEIRGGERSAPACRRRGSRRAASGRASGAGRACRRPPASCRRSASQSRSRPSARATGPSCSGSGRAALAG